jgi:hypothetical protein
MLGNTTASILLINFHNAGKTSTFVLNYVHKILWISTIHCVMVTRRTVHPLYFFQTYSVQKFMFHYSYVHIRGEHYDTTHTLLPIPVTAYYRSGVDNFYCNNNNLFQIQENTCYRSNSDDHKRKRLCFTFYVDLQLQEQVITTEAQNLLGCTAVFLIECRHGSTSQKILSFIFAAVRTWNLTYHNSFFHAALVETPMSCAKRCTLFLGFLLIASRAALTTS